MSEVETPVVYDSFDRVIIETSITYARFYKENPKNFIRCFLKFAYVRTICAFICETYRRNKIINESDLAGLPDLKTFCGKLNTEKKYQELLERTLTIIWAITKDY